MDDKTRSAMVYYTNQAGKFWLGKGLYLEAMIARMLQKSGNPSGAMPILASLLERSILKEETGRYWKQYNGYHWTEFPIETQALLIEAFDQADGYDTETGQMRIWLLKNKQTNRWKTPKATVAAIHAILEGLDPGQLTKAEPARIRLGAKQIFPAPGEAFEAGTGYYEHRLDAGQLFPEMKQITLENPNDHIVWGGVYWQYFQDIDRIEGYENTPMKIRKELYRVELTTAGEKWKILKEGEKVSPGEKIMVRLRLESDRPMEYIHVKDPRGGGMEPLEALSGYRWSEGLVYYQSPGDSGMQFFIEHLPRGVFMIEYPLRAVHSGDFSNGPAKIQCLYAPEFSGHSEGGRVWVEE